MIGHGIVLLDFRACKKTNICQESIPKPGSAGYPLQSAPVLALKNGDGIVFIFFNCFSAFCFLFLSNFDRSSCSEASVRCGLFSQG